MRSKMLKVMLVDDEPFILQGLEVIIDWKAEGFEIVKKAVNGKDALQYLEEHEVDLVITDIRMPEMNGLELLEAIRDQLQKNCYLIILSGYSDFKYAKAAIQYECVDYLLKPVQKDTLLECLRTVMDKNQVYVVENRKTEQLERSYLDQNILSLLRGKWEKVNLDYVKKHLNLQGEIRYIHITMDHLALIEELTDDEIQSVRQDIYESAARFLGNYADHLFVDLFDYVEEYEVGFIFCDYMAGQSYGSKEEMFESMIKHIQLSVPEYPIIMLVGKAINDPVRLPYSYSSAGMMRSYKNFQEKQTVYIYDEGMQIEQSRAILSKQSLDLLVQAVNQNNRTEIEQTVDALFDDMEREGVVRDNMALNTNYLLFNLLHLAVEQDPSINQEEVLAYMTEKMEAGTFSRGTRMHMKEFAAEYAEYLIQLRKNSSRGILDDIDAEIREHYADNLTLRSLSQKFYINSSYLGQIFKKRYGQSFRDYLNNYRIAEAASQLVNTDKKISQIAEEVGYHDLDYFISKFIALQGCTPSRYRKNAGNI